MDHDCNHPRVIPKMNALTIHQQRAAFDGDASSIASQSPRSHRSPSTAPTTPHSPAKWAKYEDVPRTSSQEPYIHQYHESPNRGRPDSLYESVSSTMSFEEEDPKQTPSYYLPHSDETVDQVDVLPATPYDFAELFPSSRKIFIHHDDTTVDGNMNLRLDTRIVSPSGRKRDITLFHLRMYDLKGREFSLRRYCRDSGREICHSDRLKPKSLAKKRPALTRSLSSAIATLVSKADLRSSQGLGLRRQNSDRPSESDDEEDDEDAPPTTTSEKTDVSRDSMFLEFSNYAHVVIRRKGPKSSKRYEFDHWGVNYAWRRRVERLPSGDERVSYHLHDRNHDRFVAHIIPTSLSASQVEEELDQGGWIPPCTMWLDDANLIRNMSDTPDVVVASGLVSLVDDSIRRRFHTKDIKQLVVPMSTTSQIPTVPESVGPKRLIDGAFGRLRRLQTS